MPNGRHTLDCCYCVHFELDEGYPVGFGEEKLCKFHHVPIPKAQIEHAQRICCHFEPNEAYNRNNQSIWWPLARKWAWFGINLEPGVLYEFSYYNTTDIKKSAVLKEPDYENNCWKSKD